MLATDRQRKREGAALAWSALCPDLAAVPLNDELGDIQAKPHAAPVALFDLMEAFEDGLQLIRADASTCVAHGEAQFLLGAFEVDDDTSARRRKFDRVANQIREHLK